MIGRILARTRSRGRPPGGDAWATRVRSGGSEGRPTKAAPRSHGALPPPRRGPKGPRRGGHGKVQRWPRPPAPRGPPPPPDRPRAVKPRGRPGRTGGHAQPGGGDTQRTVAARSPRNGTDGRGPREDGGTVVAPPGSRRVDPPGTPRRPASPGEPRLSDLNAPPKPAPPPPPRPSPEREGRGGEARGGFEEHAQDEPRSRPRGEAEGRPGGAARDLPLGPWRGRRTPSSYPMPCSLS